MILREANSESSSLGLGKGCIEGNELSEGINVSAVSVEDGCGATDAGSAGGANHCVEGGTGP